jgi:hypothetical protein
MHPAFEDDWRIRVKVFRLLPGLGTDFELGRSNVPSLLILDSARREPRHDMSLHQEKQ